MDEALKRHYRELLHRFKDRLAAFDAPSAGGMVTRIWQPARNRPPDYPADLPFLAETMACTVVAKGPPGMVMVQWWDLEAAGPTCERLVRDSLAAGWEETAPPAESGGPAAERRQLVRGPLKRIISHSHHPDGDILMLIQADLGDAAA